MNKIGEIVHPKSITMIITPENARIGDRVTRGPAWTYHKQDCDSNGNQTKGTVVEFIYDKWIKVQWDGGQINSYPLDGNLMFDSSTKTETKMGNVIVTREMVHKGMRVRRGRDWIYRDQDMDGYGNQHSGTIIEVYSSYVAVKWDTGKTYPYYIDTRSDLYLSDSLASAPKNTTAAKSASEMSGIPPTTMLTHVSQVNKRDTVICVSKDYYYGEEEGLIIGNKYIVEGIDAAGNLIMVSPSSKNYWVGISNFAFLRSADASGAAVSTSPVPIDDLPRHDRRPAPQSDGTMSWEFASEHFRTGARLKCVKMSEYIKLNGMNVGDVVEIGEITGAEFKPKGGKYWVHRKYFDLASGGAINMSSIYSQIKSNKDESDKHTSTGNRSIQVQRPVAAIRHTERSAGRGFCCGRGKATVAK